MIYAVATTEDKLSHNFSKSELFVFYNEEGRKIGVQKNPALGVTGCSAKHSIISLFKKLNVDTVIVRKVGEKTLAKLLDAGFKVEQGNTRNSIAELIANAKLNKNALTNASQGVKKNKGSCCSSNN